jgi:hypothetical protein
MDLERHRLADVIRAADAAASAAECSAVETRDAAERAYAEAAAARRALWSGWRPRSRRDPHAEATEQERALQRLDEDLYELDRQRRWAESKWTIAREWAAHARTALSAFDGQFAGPLMYLRAKHDAVLAARIREQVVPRPSILERADAPSRPGQELDASTAMSRPRRLTRSQRFAIRREIVRESWLDLGEFHGWPNRSGECGHCGEPVPAGRLRFCSRRCHELHVEAFSTVLMPEWSDEDVVQDIYPAL